MGRVAEVTPGAAGATAPLAFQRESALYIAKDVYRQHGLRGLWTGRGLLTCLLASLLPCLLASLLPCGRPVCPLLAYCGHVFDDVYRSCVVCLLVLMLACTPQA